MNFQFWTIAKNQHLDDYEVVFLQADDDQKCPTNISYQPDEVLSFYNYVDYTNEEHANGVIYARVWI